MKSLTTVSKAVRLALMFGAIAVPSAYAQDQSSENEEDDEVERVQVTGSHISRSDLEGPQSLTVITSEDMEKRGEVTVFDALLNLSQNSTFQYEGPESQSFTPDVQTINLRGLGVGNTLVLINGRRAANYAGAYQSNTSVFNYGSIPAAAVERIEILSTGASAIYGSDAVAGVVNIILKRDIEDSTLDVMLGTPTGTKDPKYTSRVQFVTGHTFENANITAVFQYQKRDAILGKDLEDFDDEVEDFPFGQGVRDRTILDLNWWGLYFGGANGEGYQDPGAGTCEALNNGTTRSYRDGRGYFCGKNGIEGTNFRNQNEQYSIMLDGNLQLGDVELFANTIFYSSESISNRDVMYISEDIIDYNTIVDSGVIGPYYNWFLAQRGFTEEELGRSLDDIYEDQAVSVTLGARGQLFDDHDWEITYVNSKYSLDSQSPWWKSEAVLDTFLGSYEGTGFFGDPWFTGQGTFGLANNLFSPVTDDVRNAIGTQTYGNETSTTSLQFMLSGDLFTLPAGPLSYALVAEYEKQDILLIPDARTVAPPPAPGLTGSGWWLLTGYQGDGERTRSALGFEVRAPITETLTANLAARVDRYDNTSSSIGTRSTPSLTLEYRPFDGLLVRAGHSGSFRAPDMNYVFTDSGSFTSGYDYVNCYEQHVFQGGDVYNFDTNDCDSSTLFRQRVGSQKLGEDALKDETGHSRWIGMSWDVTDDFQVTFDYSELKLEDRVTTESTQGILNNEWLCLEDQLYQADGNQAPNNVNAEDCQRSANRITRGIDPNSGISFIETFNITPINQYGETIRTIDATANFSFDNSLGDFEFYMNYSHTLEHIVQSSSDGEPRDIRDDDTYWFYGGQPRSMVNGTLTYTNDRFSASVTGYRMGSTMRWNASQADDTMNYRLGPYIRWNLTTSYEVTSQLDVTLTVTNLFDAKAPQDETFQFYEDPWYNYFVYSGSAIGREMYLNATYTF